MTLRERVLDWIDGTNIDGTNIVLLENMIKTELGVITIEVNRTVDNYNTGITDSMGAYIKEKILERYK